MLEYLPSILNDIREYQEITGVQTVEFDRLAKMIDQVLDDQFVETSTRQAIERREKMLRIIPDPSKESLEFRKQRIINRYSMKPPFTIRHLQHRLDELLGAGRTATKVDVQLFILTVTTSIDDAVLFNEMEHTIRAIKPANMLYQQETALQDILVIKERVAKQALTRNARLSTTWHLGKTPFADRGDEVEI